MEWGLGGRRFIETILAESIIFILLGIGHWLKIKHLRRIFCSVGLTNVLYIFVHEPRFHFLGKISLVFYLLLRVSREIFNYKSKC